jgi:hypothetical protein
MLNAIGLLFRPQTNPEAQARYSKQEEKVRIVLEAFRHSGASTIFWYSGEYPYLDLQSMNWKIESSELLACVQVKLLPRTKDITGPGQINALPGTRNSTEMLEDLEIVRDYLCKKELSASIEPKRFNQEQNRVIVQIPSPPL